MNKKTTSTALWDVVIIGAGPAGCAAAMVLVRMRRKVLIIDNGQPRNLRSHGMHNYLSRDGTIPTEFLEMAHRELAHYNVAHVKAEASQVIKNEDQSFMITDHTGEFYHAKKLLLATGVTDNVPDIPGMKELWGSHVFHCPFCDGFELCDKNIGLYAKKLNGFGMALSLRHLTKHLTLFTDGAGYLQKKQIEALSSRNITVVTKKIKELHAENDCLTCVVMKDGSSIACDAVFVNHGHKVNNKLLLQLGARCTQKGAAVTNRRQECSIPGVYVAGDAAIDMHFVAVAAAEGTKAAVAIHDALMQQENQLLVQHTGASQ